MKNWRTNWRIQAKKKAGSRSHIPAQATHFFTVQKPYCSPCRSLLLEALEPYGVPLLSCEEKTAGISLADYAKLAKIELRTLENLRYGIVAPMFLPFACQARISVPARQAEWAEYLIERSGRLAVIDGKIEKRNRQWADQYNGKMPTAWDAAEGRASARRRSSQDAQIESGCQQGHDAWQAAQKMIQAALKAQSGK